MKRLLVMFALAMTILLASPANADPARGSPTKLEGVVTAFPESRGLALLGTGMIVVALVLRRGWRREN
jgi:hypothetical protein